MKKHILFLGCIALLVAGCNKEQMSEEPNVGESPRHLTVDIKVNHAGDTRSVKTEWERGDRIYVVFDHFFAEDIDTNLSEPVCYMTLEYDGSDWNSFFSTPALEEYLLDREEPGYLSAVYLSDGRPQFEYWKIGDENPSSGMPVFQYRLDVTNMDDIPGYHLYASEVKYLVTDGKLTATLDMRVRERTVHFFINYLGDHQENYSFRCEAFRYNQFSTFWSLGIPSISYYSNPTAIPMVKDFGDPIPAAVRYNGVIFCAELDESVAGKTTDFLIQLIDNNGTPDYESDDIVYSMTQTARLIGGEAIELPWMGTGKWQKSGTVNGHAWVEMENGLRWATMNLGATSETDAGTAFTWEEAQDAPAALWGEGWRLPTFIEWINFMYNGYHRYTKYYTDFYGEQVLSGVEAVIHKDYVTEAGDSYHVAGNRLFFPAVGYWTDLSDSESENANIIFIRDYESYPFALEQQDRSLPAYVRPVVAQ